MLKRVEVLEIYSVRAIACLMVVALHSIEAVLNIRASTEGGLGYDIALLLKTGTPIFVMISAFVLAVSYSSSGAPRGLLRKRLEVLLPPFVVFGFFYTFLDWYIYELNLVEASWELAKNLFFADFHGYFILIVIQFVALFPMYRRLANRYSAVALLAASALISVVWVSFFNFGPMPSDEENMRLYVRSSWIPFPGWLLYFAVAYHLGAAVRSTQDMARKYTVLVATTALIVGAALVGAYELGLNDVHSSKRPEMLLLVPLVFVIVFGLAGRAKTVPTLVAWLSKYSFGIYLMHFFWIAVAEKTLRPVAEHLPAWIFAMILFLVGVSFSAVSVQIIQRLPFGKYIVGPVGRSPRRMTDEGAPSEKDYRRARLGDIRVSDSP
ncbi:membrane-bound acyltransferase YfiQ involved in biofilm formation [Rhodococcus sp. SMB37]|uniref:acyltransferase family protein n=1 Tax=Rhodococcus sp. SMB37 TaxID=2512213 RepID=UPI001051A555|nr:acyltransferase [Rhodococcus sp. SMB37]TCN49156.1 membrane-bound acyltransferase YfiQ involved in biofilm formation [Rhodococcus sp. SMB37]